MPNFAVSIQTGYFESLQKSLAYGEYILKNNDTLN